MGRGIAAAFARAGFPTTIVDLDESALEAARAEIETRLEAGDPSVTTSTDLEAAGANARASGRDGRPRSGLRDRPRFA
jgi:3-hydroxyacyl-CoA dehydrogenase